MIGNSSNVTQCAGSGPALTAVPGDKVKILSIVLSVSRGMPLYEPELGYLRMRGRYDPPQNALTSRGFGGTLRTARFWIFFWLRELQSRRGLWWWSSRLCIARYH